MSDGLDSHVPQVVSIQSQKTIAVDIMQHKQFSVLRQVSVTMTYSSTSQLLKYKDQHSKHDDTGVHHNG